MQPINMGAGDGLEITNAMDEAIIYHLGTTRHLAYPRQKFMLEAIRACQLIFTAVRIENIHRDIIVVATPGGEEVEIGETFDYVRWIGSLPREEMQIPI
jgi:hypothetical protein